MEESKCPLILDGWLSVFGGSLPRKQNERKEARFITHNETKIEKKQTERETKSSDWDMELGRVRSDRILVGWLGSRGGGGRPSSPVLVLARKRRPSPAPVPDPAPADKGQWSGGRYDLGWAARMGFQTPGNSIQSSCLNVRRPD
ncbi:hypothetical protein H6P81_015216 [Aristolochia fimbriata]|uniref:Uncharacterized protein n=1 Tax=Aristolochia fimbriata TaxID=158543 RepID=A0AAV7E7R2_ARIFI|nr:hypothetical protein H6P81_015216 [Aristolochia fimbriata]